MLIGTSKVVDLMCVSVDYDNPRAEEFLQSTWGAINLIGHYALAVSSKNTKFKLSKEQMVQLIEERGFEAEPLLKLHVKIAINMLHRGLLQTIKMERTKENGCMVNMSDHEWTKLLDDLTFMSGGAMSVMSCTSSNKFPFALFHLVNWVTRVMTFFYLVSVYGGIASELNRRDNQMPFTCIGGTVDPHPKKDEPYCPTRFYVYVNVFFALTLYFILGCLEMYHCLSKIWESGLVLKNYKMVVDAICSPIVSSSARPPNLSELSLNKKKTVEPYASKKHLGDQVSNNGSEDFSRISVGRSGYYEESGRHKDMMLADL